MSEITLNQILDSLTDGSASFPQSSGHSMITDEMTHRGAGISFVERWALSNKPDALWVWRIMWIPRHVRGWKAKSGNRPVRLAFGVAGSEEEAQKIGRRAATIRASARRLDQKESAA